MITQISLPPLPMSLTHPTLAALHPSVPPSWISLATFAAPFLHPFPVIFPYPTLFFLSHPNSFILSPLNLSLPSIGSSCFQLSASVSVTVLCTQWFVRPGSQSLHTAASSIIKCNGTFTFTAERG